MRYPVDDFKTKWNMTAGYGFGVRTSYGYHEAIDINDNRGGDSDLGAPLYAIASGEVTSVHTHTTSPTYGKHIHIKIEGPWGLRYIHYAHCQDIFVAVGDRVTEGQKIATLGKSGTQYAHCHFACKKQPTGIDAIAHNLTELAMWEDPIKFIEANMQGGSQDLQAQLDQCRVSRDTHWNWLTAIANKLETSVNLDLMLAEIDKLVRYEDVIRQKDGEIKTKDEELAHLKQQVTELTAQVATLSGQVAEAQQENKEQKERIDSAQETIRMLASRLEELKNELNAMIAEGIAGRSGLELIQIGIRKLFGGR